MIKRISLVWKRSELSDADFRRLWLGEHVDFARKIPGVREYTIDFVTYGPPGAPSGIATLRFDDKRALDKAFPTHNSTKICVARAKRSRNPFRSSWSTKTL